MHTATTLRCRPINDLFDTLLGGGEDEDPSGQPAVSSEDGQDQKPYIYDGSLSTPVPTSTRKGSEQKAKAIVLKNLMKKIDEKRDENGGKSEEETSGVATGSNEDSRSSGSEPHSTDGDDDEKDEKLYDSVDGGIGEENLPNGYESTKPVNLKKESKISLNPQGKGGGQDFIWNLAKGISQESGDAPVENRIQALLQGNELTVDLMVCSHCLSPDTGTGTGLRTGKLGCRILCRTFHTTPDSGPDTGPGNSRMGFIAIFQDLKVTPVMSCNWFLVTFAISNCRLYSKWCQFVGK